MVLPSAPVCRADQVTFSIYEVAEQIGVVPATIRNWEKQGIFTSKRTPNGYRIFDFHAIEYLKKIKQYSKDENMGIVLTRVGNMLLAVPRISELDLNPIMYDEAKDEFVAADCRIRIE